MKFSSIFSKLIYWTWHFRIGLRFLWDFCIESSNCILRLVTDTAEKKMWNVQLDNKLFKPIFLFWVYCTTRSNDPLYPFYLLTLPLQVTTNHRSWQNTSLLSGFNNTAVSVIFIYFSLKKCFKTVCLFKWFNSQ